MNRREFLTKSLIAFNSTIGVFVAPLYSYFFPDKGLKSKIVIAQDEQLQPREFSLDPDRLLKLLDDAMMCYFDVDKPEKVWRKVVRPGEVVGLKVNCLSGRGNTTHVELVDAVCERLQQAGIKSSNIVIWDRFNSDLEEAGFKIKTRGSEVRCFGNDTLGFEDKLYTFGSAGSLICKTLTRVCDAVINLPVLKDHSIAGVTIALKNFFGAIHNPNKYHLNTGDPYIPDVFMFSPIRQKVRLTICDATVAQYHGGPSYMPQWCWPFNGLLISEDPVALDYIGWQIIEEKRKEKGMKPLKAEGREPTYIATAADLNHRLGTNNPNRIEIIRT